MFLFTKYAPHVHAFVCMFDTALNRFGFSRKNFADSQNSRRRLQKKSRGFRVVNHVIGVKIFFQAVMN